VSDDHEDYLQNDPGRAGGLISNAQGEFVAESPGGAFNPRAFRAHGGQRPSADEAPGGTEDDDTEDDDTEDGAATPEPPMDDERMSGPGEEIEKAR
jgi:hypothetical protein